MTRSGGNLYSRFVAWTKIILPLAALAILSSLFLFSRSFDPSKGARLFNGNLAEFARKQRITAPRFAGMTTDGAAIRISAAEASPRDAGSSAVDATDLRANIGLPNGDTVAVVAATGAIEPLQDRAVLGGGISLGTSFGITAKTRGLVFALDRLDIRSQGRIEARTPRSTITAGQFELHLDDRQKNGKPRGYVLVFKEGVRMVYRP